MRAIGQQADGKIKRGVGGKAFPEDYNWVCNVCGGVNRAFEGTCQNCDHEARMEQWLVNGVMISE